jgi:enoyl-CoA hydratase
MQIKMMLPCAYPRLEQVSARVDLQTQPGKQARRAKILQSTLYTSPMGRYPAMTMTPEPELLCQKRGNAGIITLNRPQALNALTMTMVRGMAAALDEWEHDPQVTRIVVQGAGEKAFCAGGDIRQLYELGKAGKQDEALTFWREEYILNVRIQNYPKQYICLIDGIVMGGGVGISLHGSHRVAGDKYMFAMPEVGIGFFPDVGATYALPRLPGAAGMYLAVTGERVKRDDALALGLATHGVASAQMPALIDALCEGEDPTAVLASFAAAPAPAPIALQRELIDDCFAKTSVAAILAQLESHAGSGNTFARKLSDGMKTRSPLSMVLACEQIKRGQKLDFREAMRTEYRIVSRIMHGHDFYEGVRALIIDKDNAPAWKPDVLADVTSEMINAHFAPLGSDELPV